MKHYHRLLLHALALDAAIRIARLTGFFLIGAAGIWLIKALS